MKLNRVTFTGADNTVNPEDLVNLSQEFPFVEWGILFHGGLQDKFCPRYPSLNWIEDLTNLCSGKVKVNLAAHLCGQWVAHMLLLPKFSWLTNCPVDHSKFKRIQVNTHGEDLTKVAHAPYFGIKKDKLQLIFQADGVNDPMIKRWVENGLGVPLFDVSSGAGMTPDQMDQSWPSAWPNAYCGYAGGLGPHNVVDQLKLIEQAAGDSTIWIDMESRVRTRIKIEEGKPARDVFDLDKVRDVLEQIKPYVQL